MDRNIRNESSFKTYIASYTVGNIQWNNVRSVGDLWLHIGNTAKGAYWKIENVETGQLAYISDAHVEDAELFYDHTEENFIQDLLDQAA
jgi:hypothetical protein